MKETNHDKDCRKLTRQIKDNSESENKLSVHSHDKINSKEENTKNELIEKIFHRNNLNEAFRRVKSNKGSAGVDGISTEELLKHLKENKYKILGQIRARKYKPKPVKRVQIPKSNGKKRNLGIPTTTDRVIQQAIAQIQSPIYEKKFSENSYGFRPKRSAHDALKG
ncbi:MAG: reverse transcriptase domain-containing protein [Anaerococcus vaginalis]|nr:reverse transcriptase domain-containing protein [Anaerococcus vaginalis]